MLSWENTTFELAAAGVSPDGVWGYPTGASTEEGRRLIEERANNVVDYVRTTLARVEAIRQRGDHKRTPRQRST